jgi:hypothetical protein
VAPHRRRYEDDAGTASKLTGLQRSIKEHERAITLDVYDGAGSENVRIEAVIITELKFSEIERQVLSPARQR